MPGLSHYWLSGLGEARCADCDRSWPCHLSAWGGFYRQSRCNVCGGTVSFTIDG